MRNVSAQCIHATSMEDLHPCSIHSYACRYTLIKSQIKPFIIISQRSSLRAVRTIKLVSFTVASEKVFINDAQQARVTFRRMYTMLFTRRMFSMHCSSYWPWYAMGYGRVLSISSSHACACVRWAGCVGAGTCFCLCSMCANSHMADAVNEWVSCKNKYLFRIFLIHFKLPPS